MFHFPHFCNGFWMRMVQLGCGVFHFPHFCIGFWMEKVQIGYGDNICLAFSRDHTPYETQYLTTKINILLSILIPQVFIWYNKKHNTQGNTSTSVKLFWASIFG